MMNYDLQILLQSLAFHGSPLPGKRRLGGRETRRAAQTRSRALQRTPVPHLRRSS